MANEEQVAFWNGDASKRWTDHQETMDVALRPYGDAAIEAARLGKGMRVLDVGCGCGDTTLAASRLVGSEGEVVGVDLSEPMLARARQRAQTVDNVRFVAADASTYALADGTPFDAAISRFGVMFFAEPRRAFEHVRSLLRTDGRLAFAAWAAYRDNPWAKVPVEIVTKILGVEAAMESEGPGPFAFGDGARLEKLLVAAGFREVHVRAFDRPFGLGTTLDEAVTYAAQMGPASRLLREATDEARARALTALRARIEALAPTYVLGSRVWVVTAKA